ncbi:Oidioi.mRNA.OKI2018_I69.chr2.g6640.t1.cds [Oikopleura dioica]|uniref:Oidioi.mRNA.OKI2018_I69.chr2.g6640.t1.cds n=1 Tax=Oikopleura dioica TaxID=34765 RepID=A0ABN7T7H9_OIKDI|nr:Oidioi.mRNA.OKI2018_I69.chr2.g6640.t1.cds [Oikopleura dioica]
MDRSNRKTKREEIRDLQRYKDIGYLTSLVKDRQDRQHVSNVSMYKDIGHMFRRATKLFDRVTAVNKESKKSSYNVRELIERAKSTYKKVDDILSRPDVKKMRCTQKPEVSPGLSADSIESPEKYKSVNAIAPPKWTNKEEETTTEYSLIISLSTRDPKDDSDRANSEKKTSGKRTEAEKAVLKLQKQQLRKAAKKSAKLAAKEKTQKEVEKPEKVSKPVKVENIPERVCETPSWFEFVSCSDGRQKNSVCETSCYGQGITFDKKEMKSTCQCTEGVCEWDNKNGPSCVIIKSEKNVTEDKEKEVPDFCEELEWLESGDVICSEKNHKDSVCLMKSCSKRQISTAVKCKCYTKDDDVSKCKWQEELKDDFTKRGPRCIRQEKRGLTDERCEEEDWYASSFGANPKIECTKMNKDKSVCQHTQCKKNQAPIPATCMCFDRSSDTKKCKWNRRPDCGNPDKVEDPISLGFRSSQRCHKPTNWDYINAVKCTNGYNKGSECRINRCPGTMVQATATCSCYGIRCTWLYDHGEKQPTCVHEPQPSSKSQQGDGMLSDVGMGGLMEVEELEEQDIESFDFSSRECDSIENGYTICTSRNHEGSKCRRLDCQSTETICVCGENGCSYDKGLPTCMSKAVMARGCDKNGCDGCDKAPWMDQPTTQCTHFNFPGSQCYRSNCYHPLQSTRATCLCESVNGVTKCDWNSSPTCFRQARYGR